MFPERYTASNSLTQASIPESNLIPNIALEQERHDLPNHPIHDWRNIFAAIPICELTESQMRKTPTRQEQAVNYSPKYSSAKIIIRKEKLSGGIHKFYRQPI